MRSVKVYSDLPQVTPSKAIRALAKAAQGMGVQVQENTTRASIQSDGKRVLGIDAGKTSLDCDVVVNCGGIWGREIGKKNNVNIPLHPVQMYTGLTNSVQGTSSSMPIIRDPDAQIFIREKEGRLLIGSFDQDARSAFDLVPGNIDPSFHDASDNFEFGSLKPDAQHFASILKNAKQVIPSLADVDPKNITVGAEAFTPDGQYDFNLNSS